jgi:hypothetical protein
VGVNKKGDTKMITKVLNSESGICINSLKTAGAKMLEDSARRTVYELNSKYAHIYHGKGMPEDDLCTCVIADSYMADSAYLSAM